MPADFSTKILTHIYICDISFEKHILFRCIIYPSFVIHQWRSSYIPGLIARGGHAAIFVVSGHDGEGGYLGGPSISSVTYCRDVYGVSGGL